VPIPPSSQVARDAFALRAHSIVERFHELPKKGLSPYESRWGYFKRESYRLIRSTKSQPGGHNAMKSIVTMEDRDPPRIFYRGNEFYYGLIAIDPHHDVLDDKRLSLIARQLAYADLHEVPPHYLVGFLYQSGASTEISKKLKARAREPWFGR
jgi:hypothetical protein